MSTQVEIRAPAEQTEGTRSQILRWLKSVGEAVAENEPLIELETDKVTVEVPSPGSGTLREILKQEQDEISPGELLGRIEAAAGAVASGPAAAAGAVASGPAAAAGAAASGHAAMAGAGAPGSAARAVASGSAAATSNAGDATRSVRSAADVAMDGSADAVVSVPTGVTPNGFDGATAVNGGRVGSHDAAPSGVAASDTGAGVITPGPAAQSLSPAVKRLLAERGLDASNVQGTGQGGRITVADVLAHGQSRAAAHHGATSADQGSAAANQGATDVGGPSHRVPHTATRKRIAEHMVQSLLQTAPHVTTVFEADLTAVLGHRERNKDDFARRGAPLTLTAYFLQASAAAIRAVPEANSRWTDSALQVFDAVHIGVATALDTGLVVPVLRDVQSRDLFETAKGLDDLVSRARQGQLTPPDMRGGTFTISNHGVSGSLLATPIIINQPQSAILGVGKLEKRPVVIASEDTGEDRIVIRPQCYVTLTIDHRVMDGHQANRFLQTFVEWLAKPR